MLAFRVQFQVRSVLVDLQFDLLSGQNAPTLLVAAAILVFALLLVSSLLVALAVTVFAASRGPVSAARARAVSPLALRRGTLAVVIGVRL